MAIFQRIPVLRWVVPAAAVVLIIGSSAAFGSIAADASPTLPTRSAAQLLTDVQTASVAGLSGTVVLTSDLGLPDLGALGASAPGAGGSSSSDLTSLASGTHTLRLWVAGPNQVRVALLSSLGESDVIRNGQDVSLWSSKDNSVTQWTLPDKTGSIAPPTGDPTGDLSMSPQQVAAQVLAAVGPSTAVTVDNAVSVAGRPAYDLVLQPKDTRSLIAQVRIAIDAAEHVPLRVQIYAVGNVAPAFQVAFTSVDFTRPDAAQFAFTPPPGATVIQGAAAGPSGASEDSGHSGDSALPSGPRAAAPRVVGTGWTQVLVMGNAGGLGSLGGTLNSVMNALPTVSGSWGSGRLLTTRLFTALITDSGTVAIGAVPAGMLYAAIGGA